MRKEASLAAALVLGVLACTPVLAQVLYKWTDTDGRTQYSDRPPKSFKGEVTRIEPDTPATPTVAPPAKPPARVVPDGEVREAPAPDMATKRRTSRDALGTRVEQARARLVAARKALEESGGPEPDERQIVQQRPQAGQGGMHGLSQQRSNCRTIKDPAGKPIVICPAMVPNELFFDRISKLEAAVKSAEEELESAQEAWRRGMD